MDTDDIAQALDDLTAPILGKKAALDRLISQARLAIWRGVTVDAVTDCLLAHGIRMSPDQLRAYLANSKASGRPPATAAMIQAAGPLSTLVPPPGKRGRPKRGKPDEVV